MLDATVTSKGQITIPKALRDSLKLKPGSKIRFVLQANGEVLMSAKRRDYRDLMGLFYRPGRKPISVEEMNRTIVEEAGRRNR